MVKSCKAVRLCRAGETQPGVPRGFRNPFHSGDARMSTCALKTRISRAGSYHGCGCDGENLPNQGITEKAREATEDPLKQRFVSK